MKTLYTAVATANDHGRAGHTRSDDGKVDFDLSVPKELGGDGGPGTLYVNGALGAAWILDRGPCDYEAAVPCGRSAMSFGPTVAFGFELRF